MTSLVVTRISTPPATYTFLSWLRRGISTAIIRKDGDGSTTGPVPRAKVAIGVEFNDDHSLFGECQLELDGPGEIVGFDERAVIRTAPKRDVFNAEPNFFPMIEFDQPDLPWRYTPACAPDNERLRPWLCLIVLKDDEFDRLELSPNQLFPSVSVKSSAPLPDLSQSWAWAHAHLNGVQGQGIDKLAELLAKEPHRLTSRLLCPRRLAPKTAYTAMLVPAFNRGRKRGIGEEPDELPENDPARDGLAPAWANSMRGAVVLPVYYQWRFQTGEQGDFEFLVRQLKANPLPATVGIRQMDVSQPGLGLPGASTEPLGLEGALKTAGTVTTDWKEEQRQNFIEALRTKVNQSAELIHTAPPEAEPAEPCPKQTVGPPLYGRWYAAKENLDEVPDPNQQTLWWFQELNSDPRLRVTAALGTQVVQAQQRQLLEGAWQQVGAVRQANEKLRLAQLGRALCVRITQRHIATADQESILYLTAPLQGRVLGAQNVPTISSGPGGEVELRSQNAADGHSLPAGPQTVRALALSSPIPKGAFDGALRRIKRPRGAFGRRQGRPNLLRTANRIPDILLRMDRGEFSPAPIPQTPPDMATPTRVGQSLVPNWCTRIRLEQMSKNPTPIEEDLLRRAAIRDNLTLTVSQIQHAPRRSTLIASVSLPGTPPPPPSKPMAGGSALEFDSPSALALRNSLAALFTGANTPPAQAPDLFSLNVESTKNRMLSALDPNVTIPANINSRLQLSARVNLTNDPLEPIGAAPEFDQPMYKPLSELSQDWLLPGLDQVPPNTVALLKNNQRFIEAYMTGLNHEMARELLFHEYPLKDQRGTYFRQFWSVAGHIGDAGQTVDPEALKDIKRIHTWGKSAALGKNTGRRPEPPEDQLVLLLRGELLLRYPDTIIYAAKAGPKDAGKHTLPNSTEERYPIFSGTLKPDISFFGFNLTQTEACAEPGWFIVLKEHPTGPRFGLDESREYSGPPTNWRDLIWSDLMGGAGGLQAEGYINLAAEKPDLSSMTEAELDKAVWHVDPSPPRIAHGSAAADLAYITWQPPVRIAIHASDLLPCPKTTASTVASFVPGGFINE